MRHIIIIEEASGEHQHDQMLMAPEGVSMQTALAFSASVVQRVKLETPEYQWADIAAELGRYGWTEPTWGVCSEQW